MSERDHANKEPANIDPVKPESYSAEKGLSAFFVTDERALQFLPTMLGGGRMIIGPGITEPNIEESDTPQPEN